MSLQNLVEMSNRYGSSAEYVLAGGGNTSYKKDNQLFVKSSGSPLSSIKTEEFVVMDREKLFQMMDKSYPAEEKAREAEALKDMMASRLPGEESKRPSVEALLHNLFSQKYVLHIHPALVNGLTCGIDGEKITKELFGNRALWLPLCRPGYILACESAKAISAFESQNSGSLQILILQNHGIFFAADTVEEIDKLVDEVFGKLKARVDGEPDFSECEVDEDAAAKIAPALRMLYSKDEMTCCQFFSNNAVSKYIQDDASLKAIDNPFTPDHIVYCKAKYLVIARDDNIKEKFDEFVKQNGYAPKIVIVKSLGVFAIGKNKNDSDTAKALFLDSVKIASYSESFGGYLHLPQEFIDFILSWEAESYRQKALMKEASGKRLNEKIAIVTGSAQGFGAGIAEAMVQEGAYVMIADMNYDGAKAFSDELNSKYGAKRTMPIKVNVTDEKSVIEMINRTVLNYGGLDIFVNNAGILRSGGLDKLTIEDFELVTKVNYTAYFICCKYASVPMKIQHSINKDYLMDIIEINSKSGLTGSKRNFAYAGSKFGGVGLTQSFALELIEDNIKVNAICPGNLLDGPLWTDPEKGLFVQYLKAGKVEGAKTVEDVRRHYENLVPMKRGCLTKDVARAVFYIVEQEYETGQAIPVTGGQEMLK